MSSRPASTAVPGDGQPHRPREGAEVRVQSPFLILPQHDEFARLVGGDQERQAQLAEHGAEVVRVDAPQGRRLRRRGGGGGGVRTHGLYSSMDRGAATGRGSGKAPALPGSSSWRPAHRPVTTSPVARPLTVSLFVPLSRAKNQSIPAPPVSWSLAAPSWTVLAVSKEPLLRPPPSVPLRCLTRVV